MLAVLTFVAFIFTVAVPAAFAIRCFQCVSTNFPEEQYRTRGYRGLMRADLSFTGKCSMVHFQTTPIVECGVSPCVEIQIQANKGSLSASTYYIRGCQLDVTASSTGDFCESGSSEQWNSFDQQRVCNEPLCNDKWPLVESCNENSKNNRKKR